MRATVGSWWSRDGRHEIDVACADHDRYTLLGSCKWSRKPVGEDALDALLRSRDAIDGTHGGCATRSVRAAWIHAVAATTS